MDPITCLAAATSAFSAVQKMISAGKQVEEAAVQLSSWFRAASDLKASIADAESPTALKKMMQSGDSVETQAINIQIAKEKHREMETKLREMWLYRYGINSYREMLTTRRDIQARRDKYVYARKRKIKFIIDFIVIGSAVLSAIGIIGFLIWLIRTRGQ